MKGTFSVGVAAVEPPPPPSTTATTTAPTTTTMNTAPVGTAKTTVTVNMVEYAFQLSQSSIPSGQITFVIKNRGNEMHNFAILGNKAGAQIGPARPRPGRSLCHRGRTTTSVTFRSMPRSA